MTLATAFIAIAAMAGEGIVRPIEVYWDLNHLKNGDYAVSFDVSSVKGTNKGTYIDFEVFSENLYDGAQIARLAPGDVLIARDETIEVKTIRKIDDRYLINEAEAAIDLESVGKGKYRVCIEDDHSTYTSQGVVRLLVPATVTFVDEGIDGVPMKEKKVKGAQLAKYLKHSWSNEFFYLNTRITVKNGKIVKFNRFYIP